MQITTRYIEVTQVSTPRSAPEGGIAYLTRVNEMCEKQAVFRRVFKHLSKFCIKFM